MSDVEGNHPATAVGFRNYREVPLSYGVDILTDDYFENCHNTRVWQTDRRTDRISIAMPFVALQASRTVIRNLGCVICTIT